MKKSIFLFFYEVKYWLQTSDGQGNAYKCKEKLYWNKCFAVSENIDILGEFYATEGGRGPWDILGAVAAKLYLTDIVPLGLTKAADPKWVVKQLNQRHSSFKKQNTDSRLSRRMFDLTSGKDVGERAKLQVKLKPLVGPNRERMTRSSHRFLVTSDPNDAAVYMGDMSCHIFNCRSCLKGNFRDCDSIKSGFIGPWVRFEFGVDFTRGSKRSRE